MGGGVGEGVGVGGVGGVGGEGGGVGGGGVGVGGGGVGGEGGGEGGTNQLSHHPNRKGGGLKCKNIQQEGDSE